MTTPPNRRSRWLRGGLVSLIGLGALALPAADLSTRVADPWWGPESLAGHATVIALSVLLIAGGGWLANRAWERKYLTRVVVRTYVVTIIVAVLFAWSIALQLWTAGDPEPYVIAIDGVLITAAVSFATSVVTTKRERLSDEQLRNEAEYRALAEEVIDHTEVATLVTNADGEIAWLNQAAADFFGVDRAATVGSDRDTAVDARLDECTTPDSPSITDGGEDVVHCRVPAGDGRDERWLERQVHPIEDGLHAGGRIEQYTDVTDEHEAIQSLSVREQGVRSLADAVAEPDRTVSETLSALLDVGREQTGTAYASFARLEDDGSYHVDVATGVDVGATPTGERRCREAVELSGGVTAGTSPFETTVGGFQFDHAATDGGVTQAAQAEFDAYLGAPVHLGDEQVGTICFLGREDTGFDDWERAVVGLLAQLVAAELARSEGLGVDSQAYEQTIQQERERLEFINRFVRHNLLNGLNLVNARAEHLEDAVEGHPDAEIHLDVIQSRVEEMSELVDTIRTFMNTVIDDSAALEPVALGPRLVDAVEDAAGRYNASFTAHDFPDPDQRVVANDLVDEVFENVLSNAIEHNDASDPAIEVWTTESDVELPLSGGAEVGSAVAVDAGAEAGQPPQVVESDRQRALTVHIADNGPGIDDETRRRMLSGSDAALDDPGHGFGFYLVRETMARYGGGVRVRENEPRGTVIDLVFPLAE